MASGAAGMRKLLALAQPPSAIFAIADTLALGAMEAIKQAGLRIPDDIALIGFNDIPVAMLVDPPLTSVAAPAIDLGRAAMSILQDLIAGREPQTRASCAADIFGGSPELRAVKNNRRHIQSHKSGEGIMSKGNRLVDFPGHQPGCNHGWLQRCSNFACSNTDKYS